MKPIPENAVPCICGKGYIVDCADGTISCTNTIANYEMRHGPWGVVYKVREVPQPQQPSDGQEE